VLPLARFTPDSLIYCAAACPLYAGFADIFGAAISETTRMRPNPRRRAWPRSRRRRRWRRSTRRGWRRRSAGVAAHPSPPTPDLHQIHTKFTGDSLDFEESTPGGKDAGGAAARGGAPAGHAGGQGAAGGGGGRARGRGRRESGGEKDARLAQKLGRLQPFCSCMPSRMRGTLCIFLGRPDTSLAGGGGGGHVGGGRGGVPDGASSPARPPSPPSPRFHANLHRIQTKSTDSTPPP
jgi:hypothetical protein